MESKIRPVSINHLHAAPAQNTLTCEVCLKTRSGETCPRHPHADHLDHSRAADVEWLAILTQRRAPRRLKTVSTVGRIVGHIAILTLPMGTLIWASMVLQFIIVSLHTKRASRAPQPLEIVHDFTPVERSDAEPRARRIAQYDRRISCTNLSNHSSRANLGLGSH